MSGADLPPLNAEQLLAAVDRVIELREEYMAQFPVPPMSRHLDIQAEIINAEIIARAIAYARGHVVIAPEAQR